MKCWFCDKTAVAICKTCGRAVCSTHANVSEYTGVVYCTKHGVKGGE